MFGTIAIEMKDAEAGPLLGAADGGGGRIVLAGRKNAVSQRSEADIPVCCSPPLTHCTVHTGGYNIMITKGRIDRKTGIQLSLHASRRQPLHEEFLAEDENQHHRDQRQH